MDLEYTVIFCIFETEATRNLLLLAIIASGISYYVWQLTYQIAFYLVVIHEIVGYK